MQQKTIKTPVSLCGTGLHSGKKCTLTFFPAKENTGIVFVYKGINIPANIRFLSSTTRETCLTKDGEKIRLVEHVLAACYGLGIDNVLITLSSNEPPSMDGSSSPFVTALQQAKIINLSAPKNVFLIKKAIKIKLAAATISASPYHGFKVAFMVNFPKVGEQFLTVEINEKSFVNEIAPARTFGYQHELASLKTRGLALGASVDRALVIGDQGYINAPRFDNEIVRHKILDLVGDLSLVGKKIKAFIKCKKSGHALNAQLAKKLAEKEL